MYLVKKRYLYVLTALVVILVVLGEVRFFHAIRSANLTSNLEIKYEVENFIFAAILLVVVVFLFLINLIRTSKNILKKLDKMIEVSEYGKLDVNAHLKEMGHLGTRVSYLLYYLNHLNDMKTLKISSVSGINDYLMKRVGESLLIADAAGEVLDCSEQLLDVLKVSKGDIVTKDVDDIFKDILADSLFAELRDKRRPLVKDALEVKAGGVERKHRVAFHPVINADNEVSHVICVIER